MKKLVLIIFSVVFILCGNLAEAQVRKVKRVRGKRGTVTVVKKENRVTTVRRTNVRRANRSTVVHFHYRNLPKRGAIVRSLHRDAVIIKHRGISYHYYSGIWYRPNGANWIVVRPAIGLRVRALPVGYRRLVLGPQVYYYYYGTYYMAKNKQYEVVDAPMGAEIDSLPDGYNTVSVNGEDYYELDGTYYTTTVSDTGEEVLKVIENPTT